MGESNVKPILLFNCAQKMMIDVDRTMMLLRDVIAGRGNDPPYDPVVDLVG